MNTKQLKKLVLMITLGAILSSAAYASIPVWTFAPVAGFPPSITINTAETATIKYTVTNQSHKPHALQMTPIKGITPSGCTTSLGYKQTCTLTLAISGNVLTGDVLGGPVLCDQSDHNQCYQPYQGNGLAIRLVPAPALQQYTITPGAGTNGTISPSTAQTVCSGTTMTFTAIPNPGYGVNQWLVDGVLAQTGGTTYQLADITANHTVSVSFAAGALSASVSTLALSVNCPSSSTSPACAQKNDALTGTPRQITITNLGSTNALNVSVNTFNLPTGTSVSPSSCGTIAANGGTCVLTVTPGPAASNSAANTPCTAGTQPLGSISVTSSAGLSTTVNTYVLGYGCVYQGGFIFSVDDTTTNIGSIGGTVVSLVDQAEPEINGVPQATSIIWSSNGAGSTTIDVDNTAILGISDVSTIFNPLPTSPAYPAGTPTFVACNAMIDGACDTGNIISYYNANRVIGIAPTPLNDYAAGLCTATINNYNNWYLPAICEMSLFTSGYACPSVFQNMDENLSFLIGDPSAPTPSTSCTFGSNCLAGNYWSSTQSASSGPAPDNAYQESFVSGVSNGTSDLKERVLGVRCARALTY